MIYSSLAVIAMSASALVNTVSSPVHLNSRSARPDTRISIVLRNNGMSFEDVKIGNRIYTVEARHTLDVKAPAGTVIYAASTTPFHHSGDALVEIKPELNEKTVNIN